MDYKKLIIETINKIDDEQTLSIIYNDNLSDYHNEDSIIQLYNDWLHNQTDAEFDLMMEIMFQEKLFDDMCFSKESITGDYLLRNGKHMTFETGLAIDEQHFRFIVEHIAKYDAYTDINSRKIVVDKKQIKNKSTILHEMIHAHEYILQKETPILKEIVLIELYKDLKPKLANRKIDLDTWIFNHSNIPHNIELANSGCEHDTLFFLKSIDLDIRCGFELLTVFGYDYTRNFKELGLL
ncbi:MAG: hypothetical protein HDR12_14040 [Lachnospiraceae bacterium]|nr:hypothetical protein [Lachnospiraceae bacterium]